MKIAILSDIHSNYYALMAVLSHSSNYDINKFWILGDLIGYGPHAGKVVEWFNSNKEKIDFVLGNHEDMLKNNIPDAYIEKATIDALNKNKSDIINGSERISSFLNDINFLPYERKIQLDNADFLLSHAAHKGLKFTRYIYGWDKGILLKDEFNFLIENANSVPFIKFYGHTHIPSLFYIEKNKKLDNINIHAVKVKPFIPYPYEDKIYLINPGSVGQPRDLDNRASYVILDTVEKTITFQKVAYNLRKTMEDLQEKGYSYNFLIRLSNADLPMGVPEEWRNHFEEVKAINHNNNEKINNHC